MALVATSIGASAQVSEASSEALQEVVVTATRATQTARDAIAALSVIDGETVQQGQPQLGLDESLNRVPGLFLQNRFNFAQDLRISNRGFGARASFGIRGIRLLVDGVPATLADGQGSVDLIDLGAVERIEVLRGPASALHGNAAGGVIAIESEVGADQPYVEVRGALGEDGYDRTQIKAAGRAGDLGYLFSATHTDVDGYRQFSQAQNTVMNLKGRYHVGGEDGDTVLDVSLSHTDQPEANDPGGIDRALADQSPRAARDRNVQLGAGEDLDETRFGSRLVHRNWLRDSDSLTLRLFAGDRRFDGFIPTGNGSIAFDRRFTGGGVQYQTELGDRWPQSLVAGVDIETQDDDRQRFQNLNGTRGDLLVDQREKVANVGIFVQNTLTLSPRTTLTLGLRHDDIDFELTDRFLANGDASGRRRLSQTSPVVGLNHRVSDRLSWYANRATSFETPTTTELALPGGGFNATLDPQLATSYEVGVRGAARLAARSLDYTLALYSLDIDDELVPVEQADGNDVFFNAGASSRHGVELSARLVLSTHWSAHLAYTYSDFSFDRFDNGDENFSGNRTPGSPEHFATLSLDYRRNGAFFTLDVEHVGDIVLNNANTQSSPAYTLASLRGGVDLQLGDWTLSPFVGIQNVGNERYFANTRINAFGNRFFEPGPDRTVYGGVTVRLHY